MFGMAFRKLPFVAQRRVHPIFKRSGITAQFALSRSIFPLQQAATKVTISHFEMKSNPQVLDTKHFSLFDTPIRDPNCKYISFHFQEDDEPAEVAWTFAIPEGKNLIEVLHGHSLRMPDYYSDEYVRAFKNFITGLSVKMLVLQQSTTTHERCEKPIELSENVKSRRMKTPVPALLLPGKARDDELNARVYCSQAGGLLGAYPLQQFVERIKRKKWSDDDIQHLISLRKRGMSLPKMMILLQKSKPSILQQLNKLRSTIFESTVVEGPQELPPGLQLSLFDIRLAEVWTGLLNSSMTSTWGKSLREKSAEEWLSRISAGIPEGVKKLLGGLGPPTWDELESLPLIDTKNAGVYAHLVTSRYQYHTVGDRHLYVGSASMFGGGLNYRIDQHTTWKRPKRETPAHIKNKGPKGSDRFITLMVMKMASPKDEDVLDVRKTVTLAEAIVTAWLGCLRSSSVSSHLQYLCRWQPELLSYTGSCSHNPLTKDVVEPNSSGDGIKGPTEKEQETILESNLNHNEDDDNDEEAEDEFEDKGDEEEPNTASSMGFDGSIADKL